MDRITPCLWFDTEAEEAAQFYTSVFPNSRVVRVTHYGSAGPRPEGMVMEVEFELDGRSVLALNGGPAVPLHRGDLAPGGLRGPGRGRPSLGDPLRRRGGGSVRLAQGPLRRLVADRAERPLRADRRPRPGARAARDRRDAADEEDRDRRARARRGRRCRRVTGMSKLRIQISMSLDGYVAGADQSIDDPLGKGGEALHEWIIATRSWRRAARPRGGRGELRRPVCGGVEREHRRDDHGAQHVRADPRPVAGRGVAGLVG